LGVCCTYFSVRSTTSHNVRKDHRLPRGQNPTTRKVATLRCALF
jgi:hypothetical protein